MMDRAKVKNILLIFEAPKKQKDSPVALPPMGILYLCALLEKNGFNCDVIDANVAAYDINIVERYDLVGFSLFCSNVEATFEKIKAVRNKYPHKVIIMGGPQCEIFIEEYCQNPYLNAIFIGESENTLIQYLAGSSGKEIKGVYFRDELTSNFEYNGSCSEYTDLESLPMPSYSKVPLSRYSFNIGKKAIAAPIITSRGVSV